MNTFRHIATTGFVLLALSSCGIYNKYEQTTTVSADIYGNATPIAEAKAKQSLAELSWREFFTDPLLQDLIDTALVRNTDLNSASIAVEKSQISLSTAKLAYLPSLALAPNIAINKLGSNDLVSNYQLPLQLNWQLDVFGTLTNQKRQATAMLEQAKYQEAQTRANLISTVAQLYNQLQIYDRQLDILLSTEKLWATSLDIQKALMENGKAYSTAVNQMEASYISVKTQIVDTRLNIQTTELSLCNLLAMPPQHIERGEWGSCQLPQRLGVGVPAQMLTCRNDIKAAEHAMEAAFYNTNAARSAFYPSITLSGLLGWQNNGIKISDPINMLANAVASLTQPIFARGQLRANLKISKLTQQDIANHYVQTVINAGNEVNRALAECQTTIDKDALYKRQVAVLQSAYRGTHELMNNGKANYLEVLTAQEALLQAQLNEAMNLYHGSQATIALYIALGGATK